MAMQADRLEELVNNILSSSKYKNVAEDFINSVGRQELAKHQKFKEAIKATKNKLHQVGGAYLEGKLPYGAWLDQLQAAHQKKDQAEFREICIKILSHHASTRERLPSLAQFYQSLFTDIPEVNSVIDLACGFNPLSIPWMPLKEGTEYYAYDIYHDMMSFLKEFMAMTQVKGKVETLDVITSCPSHEVDLALILKAIPCLEQVQKAAGLELLNRLRAKYLVISFPTYSLGGRNKGMGANYEARFQQLVAEKNWAIKRFEFANELAFLVTK